MSKFSFHNCLVKIPLQGMEFIRFSTCGGLWSMRTVNMFMPPLNKIYLNSISRRGIYQKEKQLLTNFKSKIQQNN